MSIRTKYENTYDSVILINEIIGDLVITGEDDSVSAMQRNVEHLRVRIQDLDFTEEEKSSLQKGIDDGESWLQKL